MNESNGIGLWHAIPTTQQKTTAAAMDRKLYCNCTTRTEICWIGGSPTDNVSRQTTKTLQIARVLLENKGAGFHQLNLDAKIMARQAPYTTHNSHSVYSVCLCFCDANALDALQKFLFLLDFSGFSNAKIGMKKIHRKKYNVLGVLP